MNTEDDTFRMLRRTPEAEMVTLFDKWFGSRDDIQDWYEILDLNGWTAIEWARFRDTEQLLTQAVLKHG